MNQVEGQVIQLKPVGVVRNESRDPSWGEALGALSWQGRAARIKAQQDSVSELVIDPGLEGALDGIEEFSHLVVLYWAHLVSPEQRAAAIRVHPMGNKAFPLVGVFATHSPVRPNSILTSVVRLLERKDNTLRVAGLDALDGSPILDIKPYAPGGDEYKDVKTPGWMNRINRAFRQRSGE